MCLGDLNSGSPGWSCGKPGSSDGLAVCSARNLVHVSLFWLIPRPWRAPSRPDVTSPTISAVLAGGIAGKGQRIFWLQVSSAVRQVLYLNYVLKSLNQSFNSHKCPVAPDFNFCIIASCRSAAATAKMGDEQKPTPENMTMMQGFEWYVPADQKHWVRLEKHIPQLKQWGIDNIWVPPGCKGSSKDGNGYDIYDLYDLGEFDQKGTIPTKWGSKEELVRMANTAKDNGVGIYWDAVLNHKFAADRKEKCDAKEVDQEDRNKDISDTYQIEAWVGYTFPGRRDKYSKMRYHWYHFSGVDFNAKNDKNAIYKIMGDKVKGWADDGDVDGEKGN